MDGEDWKKKEVRKIKCACKELKIDIRPLKKWCIQNLPKKSSLGETILREKDQLSIEEFLAKMETWLTLLDIETS